MEPLDPYAYMMIVVFIIGYVFITIEHYTGINKATVALMMAVLSWTLQFLDPHWTGEYNQTFLGHHLSNISQVVFFLLSALTIVEIISMHKGFNVIANVIQFQSKRKLLWIVGFITFFLSAILDNLTSTVVMISLLGKLIDDRDERLLMGGAVVIAANAGGAWTPIGDVTTTMLWIGGQVSTLNIMKVLFIPSLMCLVTALAIFSLLVKGNFKKKDVHFNHGEIEPMGRFIFYLGIACLIFVPIFRITTGLPPFMGMLLGLSAMWLVTDILHCKYDDRNHLRVPFVLGKIDLSGTLFFLGILLCIDALDTAKILEHLAVFLNDTIGNTTLIATAIGLASAVVDNVPLVAATMGMYDLAQYPMDHHLWELIAYTAGTGGSILLIGSAAGVAFMGMENVNFIWYTKKITFAATASYFVGIIVYQLACHYCPPLF